GGARPEVAVGGDVVALLDARARLSEVPAWRAEVRDLVAPESLGLLAEHALRRWVGHARDPEARDDRADTRPIGERAGRLNADLRERVRAGAADEAAEHAHRASVRPRRAFIVPGARAAGGRGATDLKYPCARRGDSPRGRRPGRGHGEPATE